ncbi:hypothetical protein AT175_20095 [Vibrio parahaemolyticus]|nr:hypothetical protein AT175_20095 [Vibrio parahaemolyticus]KYX94740.1 hypothetical protein AVP37_02405 [Vibrio parahaemolyticus]KYZ46894.1 hypothetical protein AW037_21090 [Vibrio parahaemolyticus]KYZ47425.1 hypothetical protein AW038_12855 [Vibrio parahaemolyticus]OCP85315.1 hypothetical protein AKH07_19455 [Vibrio parahaemolyticus]
MTQLTGSHAKRNIEFPDELDSNFNFRCNSELKEEFKRLCKVNQTSSTTALKRYMLDCIRSSKIL